jgi:hypothetical protein
MVQKPVNNLDEYCPQWKKPVKKVCHTCPWWVKLQGTNKNTGETVDEWICAIPAQVLMMAEAAQLTRETGAAVESLRNRVAEGNQIMGTAVQVKMLEMKQNER